MPYRIVVATEHAVTRAGIINLLSADAGLQVVAQTADGLEVVSLCRGLHPDGLILDLDLNRLSGLAVVRVIAAYPRRPRMLVLSMRADIASIRAVLEAGADGYAHTTVSTADLLDGLHVVLQGGKQVLLGVEGALKEEIKPFAAQELVVLQQVARGLSNNAIAAHLSISDRTVAKYLGHIFCKLGVRSRTAAVERARQLGLLQID